MKKLSGLISFLFCAAISFAQLPSYPNNTSEGNTSTKKTFGGTNGAINAHVQLRWYPDTASANIMPYLKFTPDILIKAGETVYIRSHDTSQWETLGSGGGASDTSLIPAGPITTIPIVGTNPGTNITGAQFIINTFYGAQPPLATLTGGGVFEFTSSSTFNTTLNYSASRQSATTPLSTIVVAGVNKSFTQPGAPGTVSGTQAVAVPTNTSTTYNNVVTANNGQTVTASTTFTYQSKIYAGFVTTSTPSDADILAATGSTYVGGKFSTTRNQSGSLTTPSGSNYVVFISPASFGTPNIIINGLGVTYNLTTRAFVNASGFSSSYIIAVSPFPTSGQIDTYLVN